MDALRQFTHGPAQAYHPGAGPQTAGPRCALRRKWLTRQTDDFQSANNPARIPPVYDFEARRIEPFQFLQQSFQRRRLQFSADAFVLRRRWSQTFQIRLEVETGAAAKDRPPPARLDVLRRS